MWILGLKGLRPCTVPKDAYSMCARMRTIYLTIRLFALDFYRVIVDEAEGRINYHA